MLENSSSANTADPVQNRPVEDGDGSGPDSNGLQDQRGLAGPAADLNSAGQRWPREETLALLKIRSEMDIAFRDISPKGPLWQQVSRRLEELGYHRSAKKCKEKFENVYKYHRRTKEGRYGQPSRKTYRFFEQLEALDAHLLLPPPSSTEKDHMPHTTTPLDVVHHAVPCSTRFPGANSNSITSSSNEECGEATPRKKSRLTKFFRGLMKEVIEKQETLQMKLMKVLEKCEQDRIAREEAWRTQELARLNREHELLAQERSVAAAKDAALLAFLKKITEQSACPVQLPEDIPFDRILIPDDVDNDKQEIVNGGCTVSFTDKQELASVGNFIQMSSSRWPKEEVEALIRLRTNLDVEYEGNNGPKGPLWEEISVEMKRLGYDRSAKRCKEKWENINKYFKRMKQKNKRKPEDSKTCPYFHQLDALYSKKPRKAQGSAASGNESRPEELLMHIMSSQEERQSSEDADSKKTNQIEGDKERVDQMVDNSTSTAIMG
ncbi:trihelix transcription factor DF1-like [Prosopis cineraria]|uniref:trihelix transcription factor DF1-like n=1 Tax=Prosopis cineraria TaxID=364024 RepID=UPI00240F4905|nr:trihelix transcription factor DF1-like [Prosopis cineraria]